MIAHNNSNITFIPVGGTEQIGMNLNIYGYNNRYIMVDCGLGFANNNHNGIDITLPNIEALGDILPNIDALIITHAHEDHIGAIAYLHHYITYPIYATLFTAFLLQKKCADANITLDIRVIDPDVPLNIAAFTLNFIPITHSIVESFALMIQTPIGRIFHSGDWKIDPTPLIGHTIKPNTIQHYKDILAFICDSTNIFVEGHSTSEQVIADNFNNYMTKDYNGVVFVTLFASNIARLVTIIDAMELCNRKVILQGRSLIRMMQAAKHAGYITKNYTHIIEDTSFKDVPRHKLCVIATGSQGEHFSSLARIARGEHPIIKIQSGDHVFFSSRTIPGNDHAVGHIHNLIAKLGAIIIDDESIHASGHACHDELVTLYRWLQPKSLIPIHGEQRHLYAHARFGAKHNIPHQLVPHDGAIISITNNEAPKIVDTLSVKTTVKDGHNIVDYDHPYIKERNFLAREGIYILSINTACNTHNIISNHWGLHIDDDDDDNIYDIAYNMLDKHPSKNHHDTQEKMRIAIRRYLREITGKNPKVTILWHS